jgi:hypothetical protein
MLEELSALVQHAISALLTLHELQRGDRGARRGRVTYALAPVGAREALRWLADGELKPELAARLFAFLSEAAQRFGQARGVSVGVDASFGEAAAVRFAALDARLFPAHQTMLFDGDDELHEPGRAAYSCGFDLAHGDGRDTSSAFVATAALLAAQRCGALEPAALLGSLSHAGTERALSAISVLERLERARARLRSGSPALYALPRAAAPASSGTSGDTLAPALFADAGENDRSTLTNLSHVSGKQHS